MKPGAEPDNNNPTPQSGGDDVEFPNIHTNDQGQLENPAVFPNIDLNDLGFKLLNLGEINTNDWGDESTPPD